MGPESNAYGVFLASVASAAWAVFAYFIKRALMNAPLLKVTAAVTTVNAGFVTLLTPFFISIEDLGGVPARPLAFAFLAGFFHIGISRSFYYRAIHRIGPNRAIPVALTYPAVTAVAASFTLGETPSLAIAAGLAVLLLGITLIVQAEPSRPADTSSPHDARWKLFGWFSAGVTALLWGVAAIFFKKASQGFHPLAAAALALWVGAGTAALLMWWSRGEESRGPIPAAAWAWIFAAAACQTVAVPLYTFAFVHTLAVRVTAIISAQPLIVLLLGWLFLREMENITPRLVLGALLTMGGTIVVIA